MFDSEHRHCSNCSVMPFVNGSQPDVYSCNKRPSLVMHSVLYDIIRKMETPERGEKAMHKAVMKHLMSVSL